MDISPQCWRYKHLAHLCSFWCLHNKSAICNASWWASSYGLVILPMPPCLGQSGLSRTYIRILILVIQILPPVAYLFEYIWVTTIGVKQPSGRVLNCLQRSFWCFCKVPSSVPSWSRPNVLLFYGRNYLKRIYGLVQVHRYASLFWTSPYAFGFRS